VYNILLVEDDTAIREAFAMILAIGDKYTVTTAENGQIALDLCKEHYYDLILLDIMMPILDGIGFLKEYTAHYDDVAKIIIMSNLSSGSELSLVQDYGVERALLKSSLTPVKLMSIVEETLGSKPADS
jgi:two-component system alkaline phosphatase synthesis response regulator PhoP